MNELIRVNPSGTLTPQGIVHEAIPISLLSITNGSPLSPTHIPVLFTLEKAHNV